MQSVLLYPIICLKSDSKIESMQLISIIYNYDSGLSRVLPPLCSALMDAHF